jgi:hypothetical protein
MRPTEVETPYDVDLIILSWNRSVDVLDAIASALGQTGVSRRVLIVDQGSEPQNIEALERFVRDKPEIQLQKLGRNTRVAGSAPRGVGAAIGLSPAYARSAEDKSLYRLSQDCWRYIRDCEPWRNEPLAAKIRRQFTRQFTRLPSKA